MVWKILILWIMLGIAQVEVIAAMQVANLTLDKIAWAYEYFTST